MDGLLSSLLQCFRKPARDLELIKVTTGFQSPMVSLVTLSRMPLRYVRFSGILCAAIRSSCKLRFGTRGVDLDAFEPPAIKAMMR